MADGFLARTDFGEVPPRVEYLLTQVGEDFVPVLSSIETWGEGYIEHLRKGDIELR